MSLANLQHHRMAYLSNRKLISKGLIVWGLCSPEPLDYNSHNPLPLTGAYGKYCLFINHVFQPPPKKRKKCLRNANHSGWSLITSPYLWNGHHGFVG